jgi:hypothetical protein
MKNKLLKFFFIILINLILFIIFIFTVNFYIFRISGGESIKQYIKFLTRDISNKNSYDNLIPYKFFRPIENKDSLKRPIIIFGCSFAYGDGLYHYQTLSYKLGQYTKRPIYNRAKSGWGVQHMYYQLSNDDFYKSVPKPEYIIYVYMDGHKGRITTPVSLDFDNCYYAFYKKYKGQYIKKKRTFFSDKIIIQHYVSNYIINNYLSLGYKYNIQKEKDIIDYVIASKKAAENHWGNDIKFIIFSFAEIKEETKKYIRDNNILLFSKDDYKIDLENIEYQISSNDPHPNEKAWNEIVPLIVKQYNMD